MLKEKTGIGAGLLFMVLYAALYAFGTIQSPCIAARYMGNNGYWGLVLAFVLAVGLAFLLDAVGRKFPQKSIIQYLPDLCGTVGGKSLGVVYLLFIMLALTWNCSMMLQQSETYF